MNEQEYAALLAKYNKVAREEGHLHPGMSYDPVLDQWSPIGMEAALYQLLTGKSPLVLTYNIPTIQENAE